MSTKVAIRLRSLWRQAKRGYTKTKFANLLRISKPTLDAWLEDGQIPKGSTLDNVFLAIRDADLAAPEKERLLTLFDQIRTTAQRANDRRYETNSPKGQARRLPRRQRTTPERLSAAYDRNPLTITNPPEHKERHHPETVYIVAVASEFSSELIRVAEVLEASGYAVTTRTRRAVGATPEQDLAAAAFVIVFAGESGSETVRREYELARSDGRRILVYRRRGSLSANPTMLKILAAYAAFGQPVEYDTAEQLSQNLLKDMATAASVASTPSGRVVEVFTQKPSDRTRFEQRLLDDLDTARYRLSWQPMLSSLSHPAFITRPWQEQKERQEEVYKDDPELLSEILLLLERRYESWKALARETDLFWLMDKSGHERYFQDQLDHSDTPGERRRVRIRMAAQADETLGLLTDYPHLQVAVQEELIPTTHWIFGQHSVTLFGQMSVVGSEEAIQGIRGVQILDTQSVDAMLDLFNADFDKARADWPRDRVLEWVDSWRDIGQRRRRPRSAI